jgi:hypothetical protein
MMVTTPSVEISGIDPKVSLANAEFVSDAKRGINATRGLLM